LGATNGKYDEISGANTRQQPTVMASTSTSIVVPSRYTRCVMNAEIGYVVVFPNPPGEYCELNTEAITLR
jgi:beta-lactamase regulating signal transducer with metallopeptidase domain